MQPQTDLAGMGYDGRVEGIDRFRLKQNPAYGTTLRIIMTSLTDIVGQPVNIGDTVAVGMAENRSSVLRIGVVKDIKETDAGWSNYMEAPPLKWSIRIGWTHNGTSDDSISRKYSPVDSTIKHESTHSYAKLLVLPGDFLNEYPAEL